ncbi:MAG: YHYH protein [Anaerolineae bacterium]|nr:YHYH protein [Anaerolineae bacterium]
MFRGFLSVVLLMLFSISAEIDPTQAQAEDCPTDLFLEVSEFPGPGANYPDPILRVSCDDRELVIESNTIPHYEFTQITPNPLQASNVVFRVPLEPEYSEEPSPIPLLGMIGIAINGVVLYGPNEAQQPANEAYGDPVYNGIMDFCLGHTSQTQYHYHALLQTCFYEDLSEDAVSPIIGYALDGFPIYGPYGCLDEACEEVVQFQSSYEQIADPTMNAWDAYEFVAQEDPIYLDECNGRFQPDGSYGYHATETFPYILGCYHGVVSGTINGRLIEAVGWEEFQANGGQTGGGQGQGGQGGGQGGQGGQGGGQGGNGNPPPPPPGGGGGNPPPPRP